MNIAIFNNNPDSILPVSISECLSAKMNIETIILKEFDTKPNISNNYMALFLWEAEVKSDVISYIEEYRNLYPTAPVIVLEINELSIAEIKMLLAFKHIILLSKHISIHSIHDHIEELVTGDKDWVIDPNIQQKLLNELLYPKEMQQDCTFSNTELAIIASASKGNSIREIAAEMHLSPNTIAVYRTKMLRKSGMHRFAQLLSNYNQYKQAQ